MSIPVKPATHTKIENINSSEILPVARVKATLSQAFRPRLIVSTVLGFGLLGAVLALGDPGRAWQLMSQVGWQTIGLVFILTLPYLAARGLVWAQLLVKEGIRISWRPLLLAFAFGEFSKNLPGGVYLEDYVLYRRGVSVYKSVTATTAVSALEGLLAVPVVLGWGVPGWSWLVPTLSASLLIHVLALGVLWWITNPSGKEARLHLPRPLMPALHGIRSFLVDARLLLSLRTLQQNLLPTALSLFIPSVDLVLLGRTIGFYRFDMREAAVVYGLVTLTLILLPIPTDVGATEASGASAMLAFGATRAQAVATLLLLRILLTSGTMLITAIILLALWSQDCTFSRCGRRCDEHPLDNTRS